jgi:hypothetical protein
LLREAWSSTPGTAGQFDCSQSREGRVKSLRR